MARSLNPVEKAWKYILSIRGVLAKPRRDYAEKVLAQWTLTGRVSTLPSGQAPLNLGTRERYLIEEKLRDILGNYSQRPNAPLKGAQQIGSNMTEVEHGDLTILYSYKTPVAFLAPQGGYVTEHRWSVTTSKHIAKFFDRHGYDRKGAHKLPQEDLESIVSAGALRDAPVTLIGDPGHAEAQRETVRRLTRRGNPRAYVTGEFGDAEDYEARIEADVEQAQPDDFAPYNHPGKFEGEPLIILRLHEMSQMGGDEELGEVDCFGWYSLLTGVKTSDGVLHFIVHEDSNGFFGIHESATDEKVINDVWNELQDEYDKSGCAEGD